MMRSGQFHRIICGLIGLAALCWAVQSPVFAADNETLLEKMKRERGVSQPAPEPEAAPEPKVEPEIEIPPTISHEEPIIEKPPSSDHFGLKIPPALPDPELAPQDDIHEGRDDHTRPAARPLDWPPERFMQELPKGDEGADAGKRAVTFRRAGYTGQALPAKKDEQVRLEQKAYPGYILGPGDKLKISVFGEESLSGTFAVSDSGHIAYPLLGDVPVLNMSVPQVRQALTERLLDGYLKDPDIAIEVLEFQPFYITGEVRSPGSYAYITDMNVMNAVVLAGGFTFRADQDEVEIQRNTASGTVKLEDVGTDEKVVPGDIILVEERFF